MGGGTGEGAGSWAHPRRRSATQPRAGARVATRERPFAQQSDGSAARPPAHRLLDSGDKLHAVLAVAFKEYAPFRKQQANDHHTPLLEQHTLVAGLDRLLTSKSAQLRDEAGRQAGEQFADVEDARRVVLLGVLRLGLRNRLQVQKVPLCERLT